MPETVRALIVILFLGGCVFAFARKTVYGTATDAEDFARRRNLWIALTAVAFLAGNYWVYITCAAFIALFGLRRDPNPLALYFMLAFAVPRISGKISGLGLMDQLFTIEIVRLLGLVILLPTLLALRKRKDVPALGSVLPDVLVIAYLLLYFVYMLQGTTVTNALRLGFFYPFLEYFLPYYVASRQMRTLKDFREALTAFAFVTLVMAAIGTFEYVKHWLVYHVLAAALSGAEPWGFTYVGRGEGLRAITSVGQPIPMGYMMLVGMAFWLYLRRFVANALLWRAGLALLCLGSISALSRGPWVGTVAMVLVFLGTGPAPVRGVFKFGLAALAAGAVALASPLGPKIIALIPFVGDVEPQNAEYRALFIERSMIVIERYPWFGYFDFARLPEFADMQPDGFLDTLNVFLLVALESGLVGLSMFAGIFISVIIGLYFAMRRAAKMNEEAWLLGRSLLAALLGIVVVINTVSLITIIALVFWFILGLSVAFMFMIRRGEFGEFGEVVEPGKPAERPLRKRPWRAGMPRPAAR